MPRRLGAEFFGTFWLTFAGRQCGARRRLSVVGHRFLGSKFCLRVDRADYGLCVGHISGGHFNCAVTVGLWAGGRFKAADVIPYIVAQVVAQLRRLRSLTW